MSVRYQFTILSLGPNLNGERDWISRSVVALGHIPIDLSASDILISDPADTIANHITRSDYLIIIVSVTDRIPGSEVDRIGMAYNHAVGEHLPVLALVKGTPPRDKDDSAVAQFLEKVEINPHGNVEPLGDIRDSSARLIGRMIDTYRRPGWISGKEIPGQLVAEELARLAKENTDLHHRLGDNEVERRDLEKRELVTRLLSANQIVIQLWERAASQWEEPIQMTLYDFFIKMGPELVVEKSVAEANQFIPMGVCELDPTRAQSGWLVPPHTLNLWFTDLMALGLLEPSKRKHHPKDVNQYWSLTDEGRDLLADIRRQALETGGHRHLGLTQEFPIVTKGM